MAPFEKPLNDFIVAKFGGTSVASAARMKKCAQIILDNPQIRLVVLSATSGTTNALLELGKMASLGSQWKDCETLIHKLKESHLQIALELDLSLEDQESILKVFNQISNIAKGIYLLREKSLKSLDKLIGFGEKLSTLIFSLGFKKFFQEENPRYPRELFYFDVEEVMVTDENFGEASPLEENLKCLCQTKLVPHLLEERTIFVTQGFIGRTSEGESTTLGRGGSDYSASLLAWATEAKILQIWTDVEGIKTSDPRIVPNCRAITELSFQEASELAYLGAKILHPYTLLPVVKKNIPVFVGDAQNPQAPGTWIKKEVKETPLFRAITLKNDQTILTLTRVKKPNTYGFLADIFHIFKEFQISVDLITTSEISTSLTLTNPQLLNQEVLQKLREFADVQVEENLSLISLVGNHMTSVPGTLGKAFGAIENFSVRFVCMGSGQHNLSFLVSSALAKEVLLKLHEQLFEAGPSLKTHYNELENNYPEEVLS